MSDKHHSEIKILAIGAASEDVYISGSAISARCRKDTKECVEEFPLGAKIEVDNVVYGTGGGATNASVTFARAGLHAMYAGKIGHDEAGKAVIADLTKEKVDTSMVKYHPTLGTQYSTILLTETGERTILIYRGAAHTHTTHDYPVSHLHVDWIYISSLAGEMDVLEHIVNHAHHMGIKLSLNPGSAELEQADRLKKLLPKIDILSLNKEEMMQLYPGDDIDQLARLAVHDVGTVVITDGPNGVVACDGKTIIRGGMYEDVPVVDRLGAGDAFSSGFTATIAKGGSLREAVIYGSANSTSVVQKITAKAGIINEHARLHDMPLSETAV